MKKCLFDSCKECIENNHQYSGYNLVKLREDCGASNKHQRLLCILSSRGEGVVFSTEELKKFVWPHSIVGESSIPQLVHHAKKFLPDGYDIVCIRKHGYLLIIPDGNICKADRGIK
ncbi:transcriptional regulator [Vibrio cyclitrophicus]|uniref:winged helix-turn-helix domain-containing protein n=1 Tax=unclassified Vibrio TaxID=2614977 RepID=UPI00355364B0